MKYTISARLSKPSLLKHMLLLGGSGSGKTTLLLNMIYDSIRTSNSSKFRESIIFLEPHGDATLQASLMRIIPRERLVFISNAINRLAETGNEKLTFTFNPLAHDGSEDMKYAVINEMTNAITELLDSSMHSTQMGLSVQMANALYNAISVVLESPQPNMITLTRMFSPDNADLLEIGRNFSRPQVAHFMTHTFMSDSYKQTRSSVHTKLSYLINDQHVYQILNTNKGSFDLDKVINEGKVILVHTPKGISTNVQSFVGRLILARLFCALLRREALKISDRRPVYAYVDEFQGYVSKSMESILQEARKYSCGLILSTQSLRQLSEKNLIASIVTNTYWKACGLIDGDNIAAISKSMNTEPARFSKITPLQFVIKKTGNAEPFTFQTHMLDDALFYGEDEAKKLYHYFAYESGLYVPIPPYAPAPPPPPAPPFPATKEKGSEKKIKKQKDDNPFDGLPPAF